MLGLYFVRCHSSGNLNSPWYVVGLHMSLWPDGGTQVHESVWGNGEEYYNVLVAIWVILPLSSSQKSRSFKKKIQRKFIFPEVRIIYKVFMWGQIELIKSGDKGKYFY